MRATGALTVTNSGTMRFENCSAAQGGALRVSGKPITITSNNADSPISFDDCSATGDGGAVYINGGLMKITAASGAKTVFTDCHAGQNGGAICQDSGGVQLTNVVFGAVDADGEPVSASACTAGQNGGALHHQTASNMAITNAQFYGCTATAGSGGATIKGCSAGDMGGGIHLRYGPLTTANGLTIDGCSAKNGGGISETAGSVTLIEGDTITGCSASENGGGIYQMSNLALNGATIEDCHADNGFGGGIYNGSTEVDFNYGTIDQCSAKNGGGIYVGVHLNMPKASSQTEGKTAKITTCTATENGGGIYGLPTWLFNINGSAEISGCQAGGNGGGVYYAKATDANGTGRFTLSGDSVIKDNTATGNGGGVYVEGTGSVMSFTAGSIETNKATGDGGGVYIAEGASLELAAANNATVEIKENEAANGGGLYLQGGQTTLSGGNSGTVNIESNTATGDGGGVYAAAGTGTDATLTLTANNGGTGKVNVCSNTATGNGGGVYFGGATLALSKCSIGADGAGNSAVKGGGVYVAAGAMTLNGAASAQGDYNALIEYNKASEAGTGVYVAANGSMTMTGKSRIAHNTVDGNAETGGVAVENATARLVFQDYAQVKDNTLGNGTTAANVFLDVDNVGVIHSPGMKSGAYVGVYVTDAYWNEHGAEGMPFGTQDGTVTGGFQYFINDRDTLYYGEQGENGQIRWVGFICKITDAAGNVLYWRNDDSEIVPAVFGRLYKYAENGTRYTTDGKPAEPDGAFDVLNRIGQFYRDAAGNSPYSGSQYCVKLLVSDYPMVNPILLWSGKTVTLTTEMDTPPDGKFPFKGTSRPAVIRRTASVKKQYMMIRDHDALTLTDITLDGGAVFTNGEFNAAASADVTSTVDGAVVNLYGSARLTIGSGATIQNAYSEPTGTDINGGAVYMGYDSDSAVVELAGGTIYRCGTTGNGGAIGCHTSGTINITAGTIEECWAADGGAIHARNESGRQINITGGTIKNCRATRNGGAVYVSDGVTLNLSNAVVSGETAERGATITGNTAAADGAGIYIAQNGEVNISGSPDFGTGNFVAKEGYGEKLNGGEAYPASNPQTSPATWRVRQDIFIAGYEGATATSLAVTGPITNPNADPDDEIDDEGFIWVWAEKAPHYEDKEQFATMAAAVKSNMNDEQYAATLKAFRNARDDGETLASGGYLTGHEGENATHIYWGVNIDGFDILFIKIDGLGDPLPGARFALYTAETCLDADAYQRDDAAVTADSADGTSTGELARFDAEENPLDEGVVRFAQIPPNEADAYYYMKETVLPKLTADGTDTYAAVEDVYRVSVSAEGVVTIEVKRGKDADTGEDIWVEAPKAPPKSDGTDGGYQLLNVSPVKKQVMLRKMGKSGTDYTPLDGAKFTIYYVDKQTVVRLDRTVTGTDGAETTEKYALEDLPGTAGSMVFIGDLPVGTYYMKETQTPNGYKTPTHWFRLDVTETGVTAKEITEPTADAEKLPAETPATPPEP